MAGHGECVVDGDGQVVVPEQDVCEVEDENGAQTIKGKPLTHFIDEDEPDAGRKADDRSLKHRTASVAFLTYTLPGKVAKTLMNKI